MKYAYYPGCSLHSTGKEYDLSLRAIAAKLGLELDEVEGWVCCGTSSAHATSRLISAALPLYNMGLVAGTGAKEVVVPCAACLARFKHALHEVHESPAVAKQLEQVLEAKPETGVRPVHPLEVIGALTEKKDFAPQVVRDLSGLKAACYYGCLLTRPPKVMQFPDDPEYPMLMDRLIGKYGAQPVDWSYKTDCCGASFSLTLSDVVHELTGKVLAGAKEAGANCVVVACSLCHANLDARQPEIAAKRGQAFDLPVLYFSQVVGLAMGLDPRRLGLHRHLVSPFPLLERVGALGAEAA